MVALNTGSPAGLNGPVRRLCLLFMLLLPTASAPAVDALTLLALFDDKALLHIDGQQRLMHTGETSPEGVLLVSSHAQEAVVEIAGRRETLQLGMAATFPGGAAEPQPAWTGPQSVSLWADQRGFFFVSGMINDYPVRFLVDTGATMIAMSGELAARIGIDYRSGQRGFANTAGGVTQMYGVGLNTVTIGGITLSDVQGGVIEGSHPEQPLLGMSFLGQLDMVRTGNRMELKRRN